MKRIRTKMKKKNYKLGLKGEIKNNKIFIKESRKKNWK
jgi:hypothetical protein